MKALIAVGFAAAVPASRRPRTSGLYDVSTEGSSHTGTVKAGEKGKL